MSRDGVGWLWVVADASVAVGAEKVDVCEAFTWENGVGGMS